MTKESLSKVLIKKCHLCGHIMESITELTRCPSCKKSFTPINYFYKVQSKTTSGRYEQYFVSVDEIAEEDLIKGVQVLW